MSAAPQFPPGYGPEEQQPPAPPRRPLWERLLLWIGGAILILIVLIVVGVYVLLHNRSFHEYVLKTAQQKATAALGTKVRLQEFALNFSGINPTLDLYGVVVDGASPYPTPPLLQVQHIRVGVRIVSIIHRSWYLSDLTVDRPTAQVFFDRQGRSNLPAIQSSNSSSSTNIFTLAIRHAVLDNGAVFYNNRKSVMDADLHNLELQSGFNPSQQSYSGTLGYSNGHLQMADYNTINHSFHAQFVASPTQFTLKDAVLRSGPSEFVLDASLRNYSDPHLTATYHAVLYTGEFRNILRNPTIPTGTIDLSGQLNYASRPNTPMLAGVTLSGDLNSKELLVHTPQFNGPIRGIHANYSVRDGDLYVRDIGAQLFGGHLTGSLTTRDLSGAQHSEVQANLQNVSVGALKSLVNSPQLRDVGVTGTADANVSATFDKSLSNLEANVNVSLHSMVTPRRAAMRDTTLTQASPAPDPTQAKTQSIPVTGQIHLHYSGKTKQLTLSHSYIRTPQTTLTFNGALNSRTGLAVNLNHVELRQLTSLADLFSSSSKPTLPPGLSGIASFNGTVRGSTSAPRLAGLLVIDNLDVNGSEWRLLRANVDIGPSQATVSNGLLVSATTGRATFDVTASLQHWSFAKASPFHVALNAQQLNLESLTRAADAQTPVSGTLNASINAHGTEAAPIGTAQLSITHARVSGQPVQAVQAKLNSNGKVVQANLDVTLPAGTATASGTYDLAQENYQAVLNATGIQLAHLEAVNAKDLGISGTLNLNASGSGNVHNPELSATAQIPRLEIHGQAISNILLQTNLVNHVANLSLTSQAVNSSLRMQAKINLVGDYEATASIDTQPIPFAPLVAAYAPDQAGNISGQTELHGTINGPLKTPKLVTAHFTIPILTVNYKNTVQIGAVQPVRFDYVDGVLNLRRSALKGTDTDLQFQGRIPVIDKKEPASLLLLGTVNMQLLQMFDPDVTTSGELRFDINSFGQLANPNVEGQVHIVNAAFATGDIPLGVSKGNGVLTLTRDRLNITDLTANVGGGTVAASGAVLYRPSLQFDMSLQGHGIRLLYPEGVRSSIGGSLYLTGTTENSLLRGSVNLYQLSFTPTFDLTQLMGQFGGTTEPPPAQGFSNNLQLDIALRSPNGISLQNRQLSLSGAMNLNVKGTAAEPVVLGRINVTGGDLLFNSERFVLQGGTIDFANPTVTDPVLNMSVNTDVQQYKIGMRFEGPVDQMRTSYSSDPALPPADIIHLLAFGNTSEAAAANPSPPGNLAAEQKVASAESSQVTSRVAKIAGISQLSVDPTLGGSGTQSNPGAVVTIQQRVTSKIFVTFSTNVTTTQDQVIQLQYKKSPRLSFSGTRDQNGGFAFDTQIHKSW